MGEAPKQNWELVSRVSVELDGCSLEITSSGEEGAPFSFTLTERTHEPHAYYFAFNDHQVSFIELASSPLSHIAVSAFAFKYDPTNPQVMDAWVVAIQRASLYFLEILYAAIIQDDSKSSSPLKVSRGE